MPTLITQKPWTLFFSSFDKDIEEFSWWYYNDYDGLYANVEKILSRGFVGGPFDIDKIIVDVVNGKSRFSKRRANRRANRKTANRPNEQQKKDFINPARELTSVDYGELHDGSYYMSFGLGGVPNAVMVRIGDNELERVLEGLGHYYSFSADGYSFYLSYDNWEIWDHNGNGGFTISVESMNVVHDGLFEVFLRGGMPHTSSRRVAYYDDYIDPLINQGPTYEYYTDREIEEGLRPREFDGWSNRETQLAIEATSDFDVYLDVDNIAWSGTPDDIAQYYLNHIDHSDYDLNLVNWEEVWEAMRDQ